MCGPFRSQAVDKRQESYLLTKNRMLSVTEIAIKLAREVRFV